jgi:outer membrane lipoprotein carrier protein
MNLAPMFCSLRHSVFKAVVVAAVLAMAAPSHAQAIAQLRDFITNAKSATGDFQQSQVRRGGRTETSSGTFSFSRPGKFRWDIRKPYEQLVVADGQKTWFYDKDLKQVTIRKTGSAIGATPAALLFGNSDFEKEFTVTEQVSKGGFDWLEAVPKSKESTIEKIVIGFQGGLPQSLEIRDSFGQTALVVLTNVKRNQPIDPGQFAFSSPPGVDVIEQ